LTERGVGAVIVSKVNLFNRLLSGRHKPERAPFLNWPGESGKEYRYEIYPLDVPLRAVPGNFIYAKECDGGYWVPVFIGQTRDLNQRLEGHEQQEHAIQNGATHLHVHVSNVTQAARCDEERDLVIRWQPVCNDPVES
jgi:hypothetical protein